MKAKKRASIPRRLTAAALGAGLALGAAGAAAAGMFEGQTLTVGTYGGSWKDRICEYICPKIEAEGGKVEFVTGNPRNLLSKLVAARGQDEPPFDVVEITDATWPVVLAADFVEKMDPANVPNVADLDPNMYDEYKAANWMTQEGFVVNLEKLEELGVERPTRFMDLFHPALKGKITIPDIAVNTVLTSIAGFAAEKGGDEHDIDPGLELIRDLGVFAFWTSGTQITQMMKSEDVYVAIAHAGWGVRLHDAGVPVGMVHPKVKDKGRTGEPRLRRNREGHQEQGRGRVLHQRAHLGGDAGGSAHEERHRSHERQGAGQVLRQGEARLLGRAVPHARPGADREPLLHGHVGVQHEGLDAQVESRRRLAVR